MVSTPGPVVTVVYFTSFSKNKKVFFCLPLGEGQPCFHMMHSHYPHTTMTTPPSLNSTWFSFLCRNILIVLYFTVFLLLKQFLCWGGGVPIGPSLQHKVRFSADLTASGAHPASSPKQLQIKGTGRTNRCLKNANTPDGK